MLISLPPGYVLTTAGQIVYTGPVWVQPVTLGSNSSVPPPFAH